MQGACAQRRDRYSGDVLHCARANPRKKALRHWETRLKMLKTARGLPLSPGFYVVHAPMDVSALNISPCAASLNSHTVVEIQLHCPTVPGRVIGRSLRFCGINFVQHGYTSPELGELHKKGGGARKDRVCTCVQMGSAPTRSTVCQWSKAHSGSRPT